MDYLTLNGYLIKPSGSKQATHAYYLKSEDPECKTLGLKGFDEEYCAKMCKVRQKDGRDDYYTKYDSKEKEKQDFTYAPVAAVQHAITEFYGEGVRFMEIIKTSSVEVIERDLVGKKAKINFFAGMDFPILKGKELTILSVKDGFAIVEVDGEEYKNRLGIKGELIIGD